MMRRAVVTAIAPLLIAACVRPTQFDRDLSDAKWSDAARELAADSSLRESERGLYGAGVLFGTPGASMYDPAVARVKLLTLLDRFPATAHRADATERLLFLDAVLGAGRDATARERALQERIAALTQETNELRELRARLDSTTTQRDSLRAVVTRLETERRERELQLKAVSDELRRLKEIDLKPRPPIKP